MRYHNGASFRRALEQRLLDRSRASGVSLSRLRKAVLFDRFLARLVSAAPGGWVLKGGLALDFRFDMRSRTTKDIDLARSDDEETALEHLLAAQQLELADHFTFRLERAGRLMEEALVTTRFRIHGELASRPFDTVLLDISFSDPVLWEPDLLRGSELLDFAGIAPIEVPTLPIEQHLAEKVHAYTREYHGGRPSSRVKDFVDILLILAFSSPRADRLKQALEQTFAARGLQPVPVALRPPPTGWQVPYRRLAAEVGIEEDLGKAYGEIAEFLNPAFENQALGTWNPQSAAWEVVS